MNRNTANIIDKAGFIAFVEELSKSFKNSPGDWENSEINSYLDGVASWVGDMEGYYANQDLLNEVKLEDINWRVFADILIAASMYE